LKYAIEIDGTRVAESEIPRDQAIHWTPIEVDLSKVAGASKEVRFIIEGFFDGPVLPYWGNLKIGQK
jgi:hypothetical protein